MPLLAPSTRLRRGTWSLGRLAGAAVLLLTVTAPAVAHERWVAHSLLSEFDRTLFETVCVVNVATLVGILAVGALLLHVSARMRAAASTKPDRLSRARQWAPTIVGVTFGLGLCLLVLDNRYVAPDLVARGREGDGLVMLAGVAGLLLMVGFQAKLAGWASLLIFVWALLRRPFQDFDGEAISLVNVINYIDVVGVSIYLGMVGRGALAVDRRLVAESEPSPTSRARAVGLLRIFLGITLVVLGLQKFLVPELPMGVVQHYADMIYEPLRALTGVSPEGYVFTASAVEFTVGVVLILGVFTRAVMVVLFLLFSLTAFLFKGDLVGHLPLAGIVVALFIEGAGAFRVDSLLRAGRGTREPAGRSGARSATQGATALLLLVLGGTALLVTSSCQPSGAVESTPGLTATGRAGRFRFVLETQPALPVLNEFFTVSTSVEDLVTGEWVEGGELTFGATMPEHGHGMVTLPETSVGEDGRYLSVGCKLHMHGRWVFHVEFASDAGSDQAELEYPFVATLPE